MATPSRRELLTMLAASTFFPRSAFGHDERPCYDPHYLAWTQRREGWWPERIGKSGFVNYYGEPYVFDGSITVPRDTFPTCEVWGSDESTLDAAGRVRDHLKDLTVRGLAASTDCEEWPSSTVEAFERGVAGLLAAMKEACPTPASPAPTRFVAVGSHHSSSDVYCRPDDTRTVVVRVDGINQILLDRPEWRREVVGPDPHALVGAGITVCQLNEALWSKGLALETQGSFDGQTLAGAISTGTHGAGAEYGAIADSVAAVVVVTCTRDESGRGTWEILQVEPDGGITDPAKFATTRWGVAWRLVQDSRLFEALIVPLGTLGVIVGYVMRVRSAYFLREVRVGRPWSEVRGNLVERATIPASGFAGYGWRYELIVNPTQVPDHEDWVCTEVYRDAWPYDLDYLSETRLVPDKWIGDITRNVNLGGQLGRIIANAADDGLAKGKRVGAFADRCYRVLKLGQGEFVQAWGAELMVPADRAADLVDWILQSNPKRGELKRGKARGTRILNPFGVRFARGRRGFLSQTRRIVGGEPTLTCTAEITEAVKDDDARNLGPNGRKPAAKEIIEAWAEDFAAAFKGDGRLHWGQLQGNFGPEQLAVAYPPQDLDAFFEAFRTLNPFGLFDNAWAKRVGFVSRRDASPATPLPAPG
jgi:FAD/FMN-containing dehydrogenase